MVRDYDFAKLAQKIAEAAQHGVQVELLWQQKLKDDQKLKELSKAS